MSATWKRSRCGARIPLEGDGRFEFSDQARTNALTPAPSPPGRGDGVREKISRRRTVSAARRNAPASSAAISSIHVTDASQKKNIAGCQVAGSVTFQARTGTVGLNVRSGYYSQYRMEILRPGLTVLEEKLSRHPSIRHPSCLCGPSWDHSVFPATTFQAGAGAEWRGEKPLGPGEVSHSTEPAAHG